MVTPIIMILITQKRFKFCHLIGKNFSSRAVNKINTIRPKIIFSNILWSAIFNISPGSLMKIRSLGSRVSLRAASFCWLVKAKAISKVRRIVLEVQNLPISAHNETPSTVKLSEVTAKIFLCMITQINPLSTFPICNIWVTATITIVSSSIKKIHLRMVNVFLPFIFQSIFLKKLRYCFFFNIFHSF